MTRGAGLTGAVTAVTGIFGRAANQIILLLVTLFAARWLTPVTFGEYSIAAALVTFTRAILYAGAFEFLLRAPPGEEAATECLVINLALAAGLAAVLALLSPLGQIVFHSPRVGGLLLAMAPTSLLSAGANWQESQLIRSGRLKSYYGVMTAAEVVAALVTVFALLHGYGLTALVAQIYTRLAGLMIAYRVLQQPTWSERFSLDRAMTVARWSAARYGATIVSFLSNYSADILLGAFLSPAATGLYRASHRMVTAVFDLLSNPTRLTALTVFSRRSADGVGAGDLWPRIAAASALLGWTALAGLAAVSDQIVPMLLGARWSAAGPIIAILCLQRAFNLVEGVTGPMLVAFSHARSLLHVQLAMALGGVALLAVMAPQGVAAAALSAVLVAGASMIATAMLAARRAPGLFTGWRRFLPVALAPPLATEIAAQACARALRPLALDAFAHLTLEVAAGAVAWMVTALLLRRRIMEALQALNPPPRPAHAAAAAPAGFAAGVG